MTDPRTELFRDCKTTDSKLNRLASAFVDSYEWRSEESQLLKDFQKRLSKIEKIIEDGPGRRTYAMAKAREGK